MSRQNTGRINTRAQRLQEMLLFATSLEGGERDAYIDRQTAGDPQLRQELLEWMARDAGEQSRSISLISGALPDGASIGKRNPLLGHTIGNYKLVSVLGRGGAGTVYLGERADSQYSAKVAVKVVDLTAVENLGLRFRAERQILASLNHPNISRLLDAGEAEGGQPYLVMEYVQGAPLDRYCDAERLDLRARLDLFLDICAAVQYAHQNLIVHRDLKPANILVNAEGVPKLLDFGIAKLLNPGDSREVTEITRMNDRLLTPDYASPEQILGNIVTTASDIYSLGIVLYQLLTGLRPYVVSASASQLELERSICVSDPIRPSAAVQRSLAEGPVAGESSIDAIAAARAMTPDRLQRRLVGDIDAIVMRALRKEPQHRYSSVERLVEDIRRHLSNEPVQARQGNWVYYSQRFVRRHFAAVGASVGFVLFVIAVAIVMSIQRDDIARALDRATLDRERAEKVSDFMLNVFTAADPFNNFGKEPTASTLLDRAARRIQSDLDQQPEVHARLLEAIGRSFRRMRQPDKAIPYLQDSLTIQRSLSDNSELMTGSIVTEIAVALSQAGRIEESDRYFKEALTMSQRSKDQRSASQARLLVELGRLEKIRGNTERALEHFNLALQRMSEVKGAGDPEVGEIFAEISNIKLFSDDLAGAELAARGAAEIYRSAPLYHPDRVMADYCLAEILFYRGRIDESAVLFEGTLAAQRQLYGSSNAIVADTEASLAQVRLAQNNTRDAEKLIHEALAAHRDSGSTAYQKIGYLQTMLANVYMRQSKFANAESLLRETLDLFAKNLPPDHQYIASTEHYLGEALLETGKLEEAQLVLTEAMNRWQRTGAASWRSARSANALGEVLHRMHHDADAEGYLVSSYRELMQDSATDKEAKRVARERVTRFYTDMNQRAKLDALLLELGRAKAPAATATPAAKAQ